MTFSGSLTYNYNYGKADQSESEQTTLSGAINGNGFIWQPWFITLGIGLNLGVSDSKSDSPGGDSSSTVGSGLFQMSVFPRSRFPFRLMVSRSDSRLDNAGSFNSNIHFINERVYMSQEYYGRNDTLSRLSWDHNKFKSELSDSTSDTVSASVRGRKTYQRYSLRADHSESERSGSEQKPKSTRVEAQHHYIPGTELSVNSMASYSKTDTGLATQTATYKNIQASSVFGWRPIDRPYSISGGARVSTSDAGNNNEAKAMSTNVGAAYRLSRSLRFFTNALVNASESANTQTITTSENASMNYYSQQYYVGGFNWTWNSTMSGSNTNTRIDSDSSSQQNATLNAGHNFSRNWAIGRTSTISFGFSQNGGVSKSSDQDKAVLGIGHGLAFGWSHRGIRSSTYSNVSFSDSRNSGDTFYSYQQLMAQLTQRNILTRVSSLLANVSFQATRQDVSGATGDDSIPKYVAASVTYMNNRAFGVYALGFSTRLLHNKRFGAAGSANNESTESYSRLDYHIGLLTTSLSYRIIQVAGGTQSQFINFSLTRTF